MCSSSSMAKDKALLHLDANPKLLEPRNPNPPQHLNHPGPNLVLGALGQRQLSTFFLEQCLANATSTRKASLTTLALHKHCILENIPPGPQPNKTMYCCP